MGIAGVVMGLIVMVLFSVTGCTDNQRARSFGGEETISLKPNRKFVNITWKEENLWIVTQDTTTGEFFSEKSSHGIIEGEIKIIPTK